MGTTAVTQTASQSAPSASSRGLEVSQLAKEQLDAEYSVLEPPAGYKAFESTTDYSKLDIGGLYSSVNEVQEETDVIYQNAPNFGDTEYEAPIDAIRSAGQGPSEDYSHLTYP